MKPAEELDFNDFWEQIDPHLFYSIVRYLSPRDISNLMLSSAKIRLRFQYFLSNRNLRASLACSLIRYIGVDQYHSETDCLDLNLNDFTQDLILTANGKWLFVLCGKNAQTLSIYKEISREPLKYRLVKRDDCPLPESLQEPQFIGLDNHPENPGVVFWDPNNQQLLARHLKDKKRAALQVIPFPGNFTAVAVHIRSSDWLVSAIENREGREIVKRFEVSRAGEVTANPQQLLLEGKHSKPLTCQIRKRFCFSPSGTCLAVVNLDRAELLVLNSLTFSVEKSVKLVTHNLFTHAPLSISITDNGCSLVANGKLYDVDSRTQTLDLRRGRKTAISGNGKIMLSTGVVSQREVVYQIFTRPQYPKKIFTAVSMLCRIGYNDRRPCTAQPDHEYVYSFGIRDLLSTNRPNVPIHPRLLDIHEQLGIVTQTAISNLYWDIDQFHKHEHGLNNLLLFTDMVRFHYMLRLAANPHESVGPELAGVEALARSPQVQALLSVDWDGRFSHNAVSEWFKKPVIIETETIGCINSRTFFWGESGNKWHDSLEDLAKRIVPMFQARYGYSPYIPKDALCFFNLQITDNIKVIDFFCLSKNPGWDKAAKKLIPKHFGALIKKHEIFRHYITLDAVLRKMIAMLWKSRARTELEAARQRMLMAVRANPSLSYEPEQLLNFPFYGKPSLLSCLKDNKYREQIIEHFLPGQFLDCQSEVDDPSPRLTC